MKFTCGKCNVVKQGGCPIFTKQSVMRVESSMDAVIFAVVDEVGCKFTDVVDDE